jgi:hypothetical protein
MIWFLTTAYAWTPQDLTSAMEIPQSDIISQTLSADQLAVSTESTLGVIVPHAGSTMSQLYTGQIGIGPEPGTDLGAFGISGDISTLDMTLQVPSNQNSFSFDFYFLSAEYPEYVGQIYNDSFEANIVGAAYTGNAAIDSVGNTVSVNSAYFSVTASSDLSGTGFDSGIGGGTGWLQMLVPVTPGDMISVQFTIYDEGDGVYDSTVLLDNFTWSEYEITTPMIIIPINITRLSPKRGFTGGGSTTTIHGENFNNNCTAFFDDIPALSTTYINGHELSVSTPAHDLGLVDVKVSCTGAEDILVGGYTYYDEDTSELPPVIESVLPYQVYTTGGEEVFLAGEGFQEGASLIVGSSVVAGTFLNENAISFLSPAQEEPGLVDVQILNPNGLDDTRLGALLYVENPNPQEPSSEVGADGDTGLSADDTAVAEGEKPGGPTGCASSSPLLLLLLGLRRRKKHAYQEQDHSRSSS